MTQNHYCEMAATSVDWEPFVPIGPQLAYHTACVIKKCLYVHGGITHPESSQPSNKLFKLELNHCIWQEVQCTNSPAVSHHASVVLSNRYMLIIGGWNGRHRSGKVYAYDTDTNEWILPNQSGFPTDAGLSSHTATKVSGGIMIIGRDGSLRLQRRYGNAYLLKGSVEKGFRFSDLCQSITSRSGHTTNVIGSKMYVFGGRSDNLLEFQEGFIRESTETALSLAKLLTITSSMNPLTKIPCGRRHHVSLSGPDCLFIHGGETFDGRSREPVGEMFLLKLKPCISFFKFKSTKIKRTGHICYTDGESLFIHGGITGKSLFCGDIQILSIP